MNSAKTYNARFVFATLYLAFVCAGVISILPGPTLALLARHTSVSLAVAGWSFTTSSTGFTLGIVLSGIASSRVAPKYILMTGLTVMAIAGLVIAWTPFFPLLLIAQFTLGLGFGAADIGINTAATYIFKETLTETLNSLHSSYGVGALLSPLILSLILQIWHDVQGAYLAGAIMALTTVLLLTRQQMPSQPQESEKESSLKPASKNVSLSTILKQPLVWLMALQIGMYVGAEVSFGNWITTAISLSVPVSIAIAAPAVTFFWIGMTSGRVLSGQALKRRLVSENQLLYLCIICGGVSALSVAFFSRYIVISFGGALLAGLFFGPLFPSIMAITSRWFIHLLSAVSGMLFISGGVTSTFLPVTIGFLIPRIGVNWAMAVPALVCLSILIPLSFAIVQKNRTLQLHADGHTMEPETETILPIQN